MIKKVYDLSKPLGLGLLHFQQGDQLTADEALAFIQPDKSIHMDYVKGRSCKFHVFVKDDRLIINPPWYDHTDDQLNKLLKHIGVILTADSNHSVGCACSDCEGR